MDWKTWEQQINDRELLDQLHAMSDEEKEEAFYGYLQFGTAGLRGKMRPGTNAMNIYTVGKATQGIANYILDQKKQEQGVLVAFDSRSNSRLFAKITANVLAKNGIKVYTFWEIKGVPQISFGIRHLGCFCGIIITASHNPKVYNGYKAFDETGSQISPAMADTILSYIDRVDEFHDVKGMDEEELLPGISIADGRVMNGYYNAVRHLAQEKGLFKKTDVSICYTPLFGAGYLPVTHLLSMCGYEDVKVVEDQSMPNGNFPNMIQPNPEKEDCYGLAKMHGKDADVILATDPDCDRLGVMVKDLSGKQVLLTGNQIACLIFDYLLHSCPVPPKAFAVRSIVSTPLVDKMADAYGARMEKVLTGFRFIAEKIHQLHDTRQGVFYFGFEESNGYLTGDFVRDKDGCLAALLVVAAAGRAKAQGMTLFQALMGIYERYGYTVDQALSYTFEGISGKAKMSALMAKLSGEFSPFSQQTSAMEDYNTLVRKERDGTQSAIDCEASNVLAWYLEDGSRIIVRPSGTEPKIKVYITCQGENMEQAEKRFHDYRQQIDRLF